MSNIFIFDTVQVQNLQCVITTFTVSLHKPAAP
jgi:hypothetical protein